MSDELTETATELLPSQLLDIDGTTLIPQFCDKDVNTRKTQNKKVNNILYKLIK